MDHLVDGVTSHPDNVPMVIRVANTPFETCPDRPLCVDPVAIG